MVRRKKNDFLMDAIQSQIGLGATFHLPYHMMGAAPTSAAPAVRGLSRSMQSSTGIMGLIPTVQISTGLLKELKKIKY